MTAAHGYSASKENYAKRLRRIEGQVRGADKKLAEASAAIARLVRS